MSDRISFDRPRSYFLGALALILIGIMIGLGVSAGLNIQGGSSAQRNGSTAVIAPTMDAPQSPFVGVVDKALPAVVYVDVKKKVNGRDSGDPQEEVFRRLFGDTPQRPQFRPSSGSGFIIDPKGYVLTNNHVVRDADDITVTLNDKRTFKAKVVGGDAETDVAVIKIEGDKLPYLQLGDSDKLRVGDWAIAIGNPLGVLRGSVTVGVISARGRTGLDIFGGTPRYQDFIQTDASINFGNSGGPLCNIRGEAIGINTAINPNGQGIGFAIPINLAKHVSDQLIAHGSVKRAMMGVYLADLTPEMAEGFGISGQEGVVIQGVNPDSPAEKAGLKRNDVIVEFDGQPVSDRDKFRMRIADEPVGKKFPITVLRDGKKMTTSITLTDFDDKAIAQNDRGGNEPQPAPSQALGGMTVRDLTPDERKDLSVDGGVMVTDVREGSAADDAGVSPNDVIEEVGGKPVLSAAALSKVLKDAKAAKKQHAVLLLKSGDQTRFVAMRLD